MADESKLPEVNVLDHLRAIFPQLRDAKPGRRRGVGLDALGIDRKEILYARACSSQPWYLRLEYDPWKYLGDPDDYPNKSDARWSEFRRLYLLMFGPSAEERPGVEFGTCVVGGFAGSPHGVGAETHLASAFRAGVLGSQGVYDGIPTLREKILYANVAGVYREVARRMGWPLEVETPGYQCGDGFAIPACTSLVNLPPQYRPGSGDKRELKPLFDTGTGDPKDPRTWWARFQVLKGQDLVVFYKNPKCWEGMNKVPKTAKELTADCWPSSFSNPEPSPVTPFPGGTQGSLPSEWIEELKAEFEQRFRGLEARISFLES